MRTEITKTYKTVFGGKWVEEDKKEAEKEELSELRDIALAVHKMCLKRGFDGASCEGCPFAKTDGYCLFPNGADVFEFDSDTFDNINMQKAEEFCEW